MGNIVPNRISGTFFSNEGVTLPEIKLFSSSRLLSVKSSRSDLGLKSRVNCPTGVANSSYYYFSSSS